MAGHIRHYRACEYGDLYGRGCEIGASAVAKIEGEEVCGIGRELRLGVLGGLECGGLVGC